MAAAPVAGQIFGHYRLLEGIGEGGMGVVYRARDEHLQRDVAIKFLPSSLVHDETTRQRFRREALVLARLNHPNIETLYGFETADGVDFLVMEYVPGTTLATRTISGPIRESEILEYAIPLAAALDAAHNQGVIHRDLKPSNILVTPAGQPKILDFGLAHLAPDPEDVTSENLTHTTSTAGTLPYLAPEQLRNSQPDVRSDLYSFGVVLYQMATGQRPHMQPSVGSLVEAILHEQPQPVRALNAAISPELEAIIRKLMDKDPLMRYQDAADLKVDLQRLVSGRNLEQIALPQPKRSATGRWTVVVIFLLATISVLLLVSNRPKPGGTGSAAANQPRVVAVLPFEAIGGTPENQALCRGLTELLTARLAQTSKQYGVEVVPASEVRTQGVASPLQARQRLGVNLVVEGSWDFAGNTNQVTYSLVDTASSRNLDADVVRADVRNLLSAEREVVERLLAMLAVELKAQDRKPLPSDQMSSPDAYQYYVRARGYLLDYQKPESLRAAIELLKTALDRDPNFALAYAGLGEAYWRQFQETKDKTWVPQATEACQHAAALNSQLAPVHTTLGMIYQGTGKSDQATAEFQRALDLDPTSDAAWRGLAGSYESLGKMKEAEDAYQRAIGMRKDYWGGYSALGGFYFRGARYDEAAAQFRHVVDLVPENPRGYSNLGAVYYLQGKYQEAQQLYEKALSIQPEYRAYANLGTLYFFQGRYADAAHTFEKALALNDRDYRMWRNMGSAYYWAPGEREKSRAAYQRAVKLIEDQRQVNPKDPKLMIDLADAYSMTGRPADASKLVRQGIALSSTDAENFFRAAGVFTQLGDRNSAFDALEKAVRAGYSIRELQNDPGLQTLREDPRYKLLNQSQPALSQSSK